MGKSKAAKRKSVAQSDLPQKIVKVSGIIPPPSHNDWPLELKSLHTIVSDEELEITVDTLKLLSEYPSLIKSKACKDLRVAVYGFRQACTTGVNTAADNNLTARITAAVTDGKYMDALVLLAEMRIRGEMPKLGALCRWVRDLDVVSGLSTKPEELEKSQVGRSTKEKELIRVLDAVLRTTGPPDIASNGTETASGPIALQTEWNLRPPDVPPEDVYKSVLDKSIFKLSPKDTKDKFRIIETTPGSLRKPPNHYPAILYTSRDNAVSLSPTPPITTRHSHPAVPDLLLLHSVLSPLECKQIIAAGETIGFIADSPTRDDGSEASILAHNFYWVVDEAFCGKLWERVRVHVPESIRGRKARGINRRFRVYRYVPGAEYRCHIDGAWPPSGINPTTDAYIYDASPSSHPQSSLFTFLIYLNDDFDGGETTFFLPSATEGVMNAYPVKPVMGSVAVFPHGETTGALLHEGTGVRKGAKYVIRTDVEYDVHTNT